jgi:hypothetical protein
MRPQGRESEALFFFNLFKSMSINIVVYKTTIGCHKSID